MNMDFCDGLKVKEEKKSPCKFIVLFLFIICSANINIFCLKLVYAIECIEGSVSAAAPRDLTGMYLSIFKNSSSSLSLKLVKSTKIDPSAFFGFLQNYTGTLTTSAVPVTSCQTGGGIIRADAVQVELAPVVIQHSIKMDLQWFFREEKNSWELNCREASPCGMGGSLVGEIPEDSTVGAGDLLLFEVRSGKIIIGDPPVPLLDNDEVCGFLVNFLLDPIFGGGGFGVTPEGSEQLAAACPEDTIPVGNRIGSVFAGVNFNLLKPFNSSDIPKGTIKGQLKSTEPVATFTGDDIQEATIRLFKQKGFVRARKEGESVEEYREFLKNEGRESVVMCMCNLSGEKGVFSFEDIPLIESFSVGGTKAFRPALYTIDVTNATSEEIDLETVVRDEKGEVVDAETNTRFFTNNVAVNLRPKGEEPFKINEIELTPIDGIGTKENLVVDLSKIGPNNYSQIEEKVQQFLEKVKKEKKPEQLEAVRRGVLAERIVRGGAKFSDQLLGTMLDGLVKLIGDVIDDFLGGTNKELAKSQEKFGNFKEALDFDRLQSRNWKGFFGSDSATANKIISQMNKLLEENPGLGASEAAKLLKIGSNGVFSLVKQVLVAAKMDKGTAANIAKGAKTAVDTMFAIAITQAIGGSSKPIAKLLIDLFVKSQKDVLLDGPVPYSFTGSLITQDSLESSRLSMEAWNTDNKAAFQSDRNEVNKIDNDMGSEVLVVAGGITAFTTEIADALGGFGVEVIGLLGPIGKGTAKVAKVVKYVSNVGTFGVPFVETYIRIPDFIEQGVDKSFGGKAIGPDRSTVKIAQEADIALVPNTNLLSNLEQDQSNINSVIGQLLTSLKEDIIPDAISLTSSDAEGSIISTFAQFERSILHITFTSQGSVSLNDTVAENLRDLNESNLDLKVQYAELVQLISDLYFKVLLVEFTGPNDPLYIAERNHVISTIESFQRSVNNLASDAASVFNETKDAITLPAIVVDNISVSSDETGEDSITLSPENFTLRAHIRNISTSAVSGLSAILTVTSVKDSITVSTPLEVIVGSGLLEADDGVDDTGKDEADVVWQFKFSGDPSIEERILLSVDILEDGDTSATFVAFSDLETLEPDITLTDKDLDGLPDDWEKANGSDDTKDDSQEDPDNDGLVNLREFDLGTDPQNADTDGDGLSDGEEVTGGKDGFVTDPLNADTDEDGVPDNSDGQPVDGGTSEKPKPENILGEPEVSVDKTEVALTKEERVVTVSVTNSGGGTLSWSAVSDNEAIALASPNAPDLRNGDGLVLISAPVSFDFDTPGIIKTTVKVFDVAGATKDFKEITVKVGSGEERMPPDEEPEPPSGKSFSLNCKHDFLKGPIFGTERLVMEVSNNETCTLKLTHLEPGTPVEISTNLQTIFKPSIKVDPVKGVTDEKGELEFTISAIGMGIDWIAWAVPNENGEFEFSKKAFDAGLAWGMFVEVK